MIVMSSDTEALLEQFLAGLRADEMARLDDDLSERLFAVSGIDEHSTTSPWTDALLERGIQPTTIAWLAYVMLADAMRRGWIAAESIDMEGDDGAVKMHVYWDDGFEFNFAGDARWLRLKYTGPSND
jgi:hypothetical protein